MSLRGQAVTPNPESRPTARDSLNHKKLGIFKRWAARRTVALGSEGGHTSHSSLTTLATSSLSFRSSSTSCRGTSTSSIRSHQLLTNRRQMTYSSPTTSNLMQWLQTECPHDILPMILSFAGPQVIATFDRTNRFWHNVIAQESTWRNLCEGLYKWKEGDEVPESWKDFYKYNPCVPVDYATVHGALEVVNMARADPSGPRAVRLLLRPARYILPEPITVQNGPAANTGRTVSIQIETMEHLPDSFCPSVFESSIGASCAIAEAEPVKRRKSTLRSMLNCRSVDMMEDPELDAAEAATDLFLEQGVVNMTAVIQANNNSALAATNGNRIKRAQLVLRTRRHNEPLIRIRQGCCAIRNVDLKHISHGTDIWNGNAAVQIQPPMDEHDQPLMVLPAPTAVLDHVEVTSASGRGIVNIDGGHVTITNCYIHDCAATGIYVGGPGSRAAITRTDVVRNGNGNMQHRRGIARGHSGIYLEQGHAAISDCNISQNSLTGISAVSPDNAVLHLEDSDLTANGTFQLEMPAIGTLAHRNSVTANNNLSSIGVARSRSGLVADA